MLTVFTTCKPFEGLTAVHQRNALLSWTQLPGVEVILFGDEFGTAPDREEIEAAGLCYHPYAMRDEHGLPYLDFMFERAQKMAGGGFLAYVNADIVVVDGLVGAAARCAAEFPGGFLVACRRWDVDLDRPLDFGGDWRAGVRGLIEAGGELYTPCSSDLFAFAPPLPWRMPPFAAGRPRWDNWTLWAAVEHGTPVVDATRAVTLAHPRHGFTQGSRKARDKDYTSGRNKELAAGRVWSLRHVRQAHMLWGMDEAGIIAKVK